LYQKLLSSILVVNLLTDVTSTWLTKKLPDDKFALALQENVAIRKKLENCENQRWKLVEQRFSLMQRNQVLTVRLVEIEKKVYCRKSGTKTEKKSYKDHVEIKVDRFESHIKESQ